MTQRHRASVGRHRPVALLLPAILLLVSIAPADTQAADGRTYVRQKVQLEPLRGSRTYELRGDPTDYGCHFEFPALRSAPGSGHWTTRVVGVDMGHCYYLVEEGEPTSPPAPLGDGYSSEEVQATERSPNDPIAAQSVSPSSVCSPHSTAAIQRMRWNDILGLEVNSDRTSISWTYNCSTVSNTSASGYWTWLSGTGWSKESNSSTKSNPASYYFVGETRSTFKNSFFCAPLPQAWVWYYYNRVYGYSDGTASYTRSTDAYSACAPLFPATENKKMVRLSPWRGWLLGAAFATAFYVLGTIILLLIVVFLIWTSRNGHHTFVLSNILVGAGGASLLLILLARGRCASGVSVGGCGDAIWPYVIASLLMILIGIVMGYRRQTQP